MRRKTITWKTFEPFRHQNVPLQRSHRYIPAVEANQNNNKRLTDPGSNKPVFNKKRYSGPTHFQNCRMSMSRKRRNRVTRQTKTKNEKYQILMERIITNRKLKEKKTKNYKSSKVQNQKTKTSISKKLQSKKIWNKPFDKKQTW